MLTQQNIFQLKRLFKALSLTLAFEQTLIQKYENSTSDDSTQNKFIIRPLMPKFGSL